MILRLVENGQQVGAELLDADQKPLASGAFSDVETTSLTLTNMAGALDAESDLIQLGRHLGSLLVPREIWDRLRSMSDSSLLQIEVPENLWNIPWELSLPFKSTTGLFQKASLLPYRGADAARLSLAADWPLRVLILVGAMDDDESIKAAPERDGLRRQLFDYGHSFDIEVLERPSHATLIDTIHEFHPHIIHFIGHSGTANQTSFLDFRGANPWRWSTGSFEPDFERKKDGKTERWIPNFVLLNACRTASADPYEASIGVARAFLAAGDNLAAAVANGRDRLRIEVTEEETQRWALPVLTLAAPPEDVLPVRRYLREDAEELKKIAEVFPETRLFALRHEERRKLLANLQPVVFVTGDLAVGKTHLIGWCLEGFALRGHCVHYVKRRDGGFREIIDLLRMIIRKSDCLLSGLPENCFHRFHFELRNLLTLGIKGEWNGEPEPFCDLPAEPRNFKSDDTIKSAIDSFLDCVAACIKSKACGTKFYLVVDQLEASVEPRHLQRDGLILNTLTRAIRDKNIPGFHLVLILRQTSAPDIRDAADRKLVSLLPLEALTKASCLDFFIEAIRYRTDLISREKLELLAELVTDDPTWPSKLVPTIELLKGKLTQLQRMK
ncbi:MAG: hypothetical protein ABI822_10910 [Bryobacteraceae bacterium]